MTTPRAQHYIPQFYLKGFSDPLLSKRKPILWVYEKANPIRRSTARNEAHERDFYVFEKDGNLHYEVEQFLSELEGPTADLLGRIRDNSYSFSEDDKGILSLFIAFMFSRVPAGRELINKLATQIMRKVSIERAKDPEAFEREFLETAKDTDTEITPEQVRQYILSGEYNLEQKSASFTISQIPRMAMELAPILESKDWIILRSNQELFVTSDNPVISLQPDGPQHAVMGMGFGLPGVEIFFPLTAHACLKMVARSRISTDYVKPAGVRQINRLVMTCAKRFLYAAERSTKIDALFQKVGGSISYGENAFVLPDEVLEKILKTTALLGEKRKKGVIPG